VLHVGQRLQVLLRAVVAAKSELDDVIHVAAIECGLGVELLELGVGAADAPLHEFHGTSLRFMGIIEPRMRGSVSGCPRPRLLRISSVVSDVPRLRFRSGDHLP
jgi:hypothetical protein